MFFSVGVVSFMLISVVTLIFRYYPIKFSKNDKLVYQCIELIATTSFYFILLHYSANENYLFGIVLTIFTLITMFWRIKKILNLKKIS